MGIPVIMIVVWKSLASSFKHVEMGITTLLEFRFSAMATRPSCPALDSELDARRRHSSAEASGVPTTGRGVTRVKSSHCRANGDGVGTGTTWQSAKVAEGSCGVGLGISNQVEYGCDEIPARGCVFTGCCCSVSTRCCCKGSVQVRGRQVKSMSCKDNTRGGEVVSESSISAHRSAADRPVGWVAATDGFDMIPTAMRRTIRIVDFVRASFLIDRVFYAVDVSLQQ